jgi:hypothetical protein
VTLGPFVTISYDALGDFWHPSNRQAASGFTDAHLYRGPRSDLGPLYVYFGGGP